MTGVKDSTLQTLRLRYNAALAAHQGCVRALSEAGQAGARPSPAVVEREAKSRAELERARAALLAAMTEAITGHSAGPEADGPRPPPRAGKPPPEDAT